MWLLILKAKRRRWRAIREKRGFTSWAFGAGGKGRFSSTDVLLEKIGNFLSGLKVEERGVRHGVQRVGWRKDLPRSIVGPIPVQNVDQDRKKISIDRIFQLDLQESGLFLRLSSLPPSYLSEQCDGFWILSYEGDHNLWRAQSTGISAPERLRTLLREFEAYRCQIIASHCNSFLAFDRLP